MSQDPSFSEKGHFLMLLVYETHSVLLVYETPPSPAGINGLPCPLSSWEVVKEGVCVV